MVERQRHHRSQRRGVPDPDGVAAISRWLSASDTTGIKGQILPTLTGSQPSGLRDESGAPFALGDWRRPGIQAVAMDGRSACMGGAGAHERPGVDAGGGTSAGLGHTPLPLGHIVQAKRLASENDAHNFHSSRLSFIRLVLIGNSIKGDEVNSVWAFLRPPVSKQLSVKKPLIPTVPCAEGTLPNHHLDSI